VTDRIRPWRFWPKVEKAEGCWRWLGAHNVKGYAVYGKSGAHRTAYRLAKGEIPVGMEIDHLCRNRGCVNPDHLEAVTHEVNIERAKRDECRNGHPYTDGSYYTKRNGTKVCKPCFKRLQKAHYEAHKVLMPVHTCCYCGRHGARSFEAVDGAWRCIGRTSCSRRAAWPSMKRAT
jgi:hypothetical protein